MVQSQRSRSRGRHKHKPQHCCGLDFVLSTLSSGSHHSMYLLPRVGTNLFISNSINALSSCLIYGADTTHTKLSEVAMWKGSFFLFYSFLFTQTEIIIDCVCVCVCQIVPVHERPDNNTRQVKVQPLPEGAFHRTTPGGFAGR